MKVSLFLGFVLAFSFTNYANASLGIRYIYKFAHHQDISNLNLVPRQVQSFVDFYCESFWSGRDDEQIIQSLMHVGIEDKYSKAIISSASLIHREEDCKNVHSRNPEVFNGLPKAAIFTPEKINMPLVYVSEDQGLRWEIRKTTLGSLQQYEYIKDGEQVFGGSTNFALNTGSGFAGYFEKTFPSTGEACEGKVRIGYSQRTSEITSTWTYLNHPPGKNCSRVGEVLTLKLLQVR